MSKGNENEGLKSMVCGTFSAGLGSISVSAVY